MTETVTLIAQVRAKKGQESRLRQELINMLAPTHAEPGCINYDLHESVAEPGLFMFYENWKTQAHLDSHSQSPHLQGLRKLMPDLSDAGTNVTKWKKVE